MEFKSFEMKFTWTWIFTIEVSVRFSKIDKDGESTEGPRRRLENGVRRISTNSNSYA